MKRKDVVEYYIDRKDKANIPSLTISNEEAAIVIGQWLGEIPLTYNEINKKKKEHDTYLTPSYLIRKGIVNNNCLEIVNKRFSKILMMLGINEDEIVFLDNFKRNEIKEFCFDCYLYNTGEVISIKLNFLTIMNPCEVIIERNGIITEYEHWYCKYPKKDRLGLEAVKKTINETNIFYYTTHQKYHSEITNKDNKLEIDIQYPDTYESTDLENPFVDYSLIENLLNQVTFPIDFKSLSKNLTQCLKGNVSKYEITFKALNNGEVLTYEFPDKVKISQDDKEMAIRIGDWLQASRHYLLTQEATLEARKRIINKKGIQDISRHFTEVLRLVGLEVNNNCILENFNSEDFSFDCVLENKDIAHIKITMGSEDDFEYKINIEYNGVIKNFNYIPGYEDEEEFVPDRLSLNYIDKEVDCCGTRFRHDLDSYTYYGKVYDDKGRIEISLSYPDSIDDFDLENPYIDIQELEKLLSQNCEFPFDICYFYNRILTCMKIDPANFGINIKAIKYENDKEYVTDAINCRGSNVYEFTITKRWRTITVNSNGSWNFDSLDWKVSRNIANKIDYTLNNIIADESMIDDCPTPAEVYREAKEDVEIVRKLVKALVQPKKK